MLENFIIFCKINSIRRFATVAAEAITSKFLKEDVPPLRIIDVPHSKYAGKTTVTLLTGSKVGDIGSEYIKALFAHVSAPVIFESLSTNSKDYSADESLLSVMRNGTAFYIDTLHTTESKQSSLKMNTQLDLYVSVVNCFSIPGYTSRFPPADVVIIMQNNRGAISKLEYEPVKGVVETLKVCDQRSAERYIDFAFKYAIKHGRKKITFGHKTNELPLTDGLNLAVAHKLHQEKYPHIEIEDMLINRITKSLITEPSRFDVLCLDNRYGTFIAAVASSICGGPSLFPAMSFGDCHAIFQPLQTKLSLTESGPLCSYGTVWTAVDLLQHLGYHDCANILWRGFIQVLLVDKIKTKEFGGEYSEEDVICKLLNVLQESICQLK